MNVVAVFLLEEAWIRELLQEMQDMLVEDLLSLVKFGLEASRVSLGHHSGHEWTPAVRFEHSKMNVKANATIR